MYPPSCQTEVILKLSISDTCNLKSTSRLLGSKVIYNLQDKIRARTQNSSKLMASFPSWSTAVNSALTSASLRSYMTCAAPAAAVPCCQFFCRFAKSSPLNFMASLSSFTSILRKTSLWNLDIFRICLNHGGASNASNQSAHLPFSSESKNL